MDVENILLFPTAVSKTTHKVSDEEKEAWFELYSRHNKDGATHDLLGFERVHTEELFEKYMFSKLKAGLKEYFNLLNLNTKLLDVHLTKAFFNVTNKCGINKHNHIENHISFTYYPFIAPGKERCIVLYDVKDSHSNEPFQGFFYHHVNDWNEINCRKYFLPVQEGALFIFPSKLDHEVEERYGDTNGMQSFHTADDLRNTRFCVAGDLLYTKKKSVEVYHRTLSHPDLWRKIE